MLRAPVIRSAHVIKRRGLSWLKLISNVTVNELNIQYFKQLYFNLAIFTICSCAKYWPFYLPVCHVLALFIDAIFFNLLISNSLCLIKPVQAVNMLSRVFYCLLAQTQSKHRCSSIIIIFKLFGWWLTVNMAKNIRGNRKCQSLFLFNCRVVINMTVGDQGMH